MREGGAAWQKMAAACIAWQWRRPGVTMALPRARHPGQTRAQLARVQAWLQVWARLAHACIIRFTILSVHACVTTRACICTLALENLYVRARRPTLQKVVRVRARAARVCTRVRVCILHMYSLVIELIRNLEIDIVNVYTCMCTRVQVWPPVLALVDSRSPMDSNLINS